MRLVKIEVKNFRNIGGICVELDKFCNYIIGENNLGKSNFLDVLDIVFSGKSFDDEDYTDPKLPIDVLITIALNSCEFGFFDDNFNVDNSSLINIKYSQKISDAYPVAKCTDTNVDISLKQLRKINYCNYESTASPNRELKFDNKRGMGRLINGLVESFVKQNKVPSFVDLEQTRALAGYINRSFSRIHGFREYGIETAIFTDTSDVVNKLFYLSDGQRKLDVAGSGVQYIAMASISVLCYVMELYKNKSIQFSERLFNDEFDRRILPVILSIDEPEVHLHPYLQRSLIRSYKRVLSNEDEDFKELLKECFGIDGIEGQIIIVTHSTDALIGDYRNLVRFYRDVGQIKVISGASTSVRISQDKEKHLIMHFPELKEAFYSQCVILIEGETEYGCMSEFAEKLSIPIDDLGICFINAGGEGSIESLMYLLEVFKIPSVAIYDGDVKEKKEPSDRKFFTTGICFEEEIVKKLFSTRNQQLARDIVLEISKKSMNEILDWDFVKKYFKKKNLSENGYSPKALKDVSDNDETDFCNMFATWFFQKKGILLGRIIGEKLPAELIPKCYSEAILKAQEIAKNARQ